jgi:hypothetical protein
LADLIDETSFSLEEGFSLFEENFSPLNSKEEDVFSMEEEEDFIKLSI